MAGAWPAVQRQRSHVRSKIPCEQILEHPCAVQVSSLSQHMEDEMFLKLLTVSAMALGLATSAMGQTSGSAGQGSGTGSGSNQTGTDGLTGSGSGSGAAGGANAGAIDVNPTNSTSMNGQNSGASGGDGNDCQRQHAGSTANPSPTSGIQSNLPDAANACK